MAAYLYYQHSTPIVSDAAFDAACKFVAANWDALEPIRQWQLGSPDEILSSGHHIKITQFGEDAAIAWHQRKFNHEPMGRRVTDWMISDEFDCLYAQLMS